MPFYLKFNKMYSIIKQLHADGIKTSLSKIKFSPKI